MHKRLSERAAHLDNEGYFFFVALVTLQSLFVRHDTQGSRPPRRPRDFFFFFFLALPRRARNMITLVLPDTLLPRQREKKHRFHSGTSLCYQSAREVSLRSCARSVVLAAGLWYARDTAEPSRMIIASPYMRS